MCVEGGGVAGLWQADAGLNIERLQKIFATAAIADPPPSSRRGGSHCRAAAQHHQAA